jgi:hypothetical protein
MFHHHQCLADPGAFIALFGKLTNAPFGKQDWLAWIKRGKLRVIIEDRLFDADPVFTRKLFNVSSG